MLVNHAKPDDKVLAHRRRHHVQLARSVDISQEFLVHVVYLILRLARASAKAETYQSQLQNKFTYENSIYSTTPQLCKYL